MQRNASNKNLGINIKKESGCAAKQRHFLAQLYNITDHMGQVSDDFREVGCLDGAATAQH